MIVEKTLYQGGIVKVTLVYSNEEYDKIIKKSNKIINKRNKFKVATLLSEIGDL